MSVKDLIWLRIDRTTAALASRYASYGLRKYLARQRESVACRIQHVSVTSLCEVGALTSTYASSGHGKYLVRQQHMRHVTFRVSATQRCVHLQPATAWFSG
jgi:hypothetical protein